MCMTRANDTQRGQAKQHLNILRGRQATVIAPSVALRSPRIPVAPPPRRRLSTSLLPAQAAMGVRLLRHALLQAASRPADELLPAG